MLANVLRSGRAVEVSVLIVRAFVRMRAALAANAELAQRIEELSREVGRQGGKLADHHDAIAPKKMAGPSRTPPFLLEHFRVGSFHPHGNCIGASIRWT